MRLDDYYGQGLEREREQEPQPAREPEGPARSAAASMRLNPPPGWPPPPPGWVPPPGWRPDPSWPAPPAGWNLWVEDAVPRVWQVRAARCVIAGGGAAFLGSLLPFISSSQPDLYQVNSAPRADVAFLGIVVAALGAIMLAKSRRAMLISGIVTLVVAGLAELPLLGIVIAGLAGFDATDPFGDTVRVHLSPQIGIFLSILGCAAAGLGAVMSFRPR